MTKQFLALLLAIPLTALAASDSSTLSATLADRILISDLDSMDFGTHTPGNDMTVTDTFCVYRKGNGGKYKVTATGNGVNSAFTLSGATNGWQLEYAVKFDGDTTPNSGEDLIAGTKSSSEYTGDTSSTNCGNTNNASIRLRITNTNANAAEVDTYSGTLTLTVEVN